MQFILAKNIQECKENNTVYLMLDGWDDWFTYSTLFNMQQSCYLYKLSAGE